MRDQAIEAMAKAIHEANCLGPHKEKYDHQIVTIALDALLDLLDEDWPKLGDSIEAVLIARTGRSSDKTIEAVVTYLIAVLRGGGE